MVKKIEDMYNRLDTIPACDRRTDGQTDILRRHSSRYAYASRDKNGVILLSFKMWKFRNIRFVGDYILSTSCKLYYDDVTVTSFINIRYSSIAVEIIP